MHFPGRPSVESLARRQSMPQMHGGTLQKRTNEPTLIVSACSIAKGIG